MKSVVWWRLAYNTLHASGHAEETEASPLSCCCRDAAYPRKGFKIVVDQRVCALSVVGRARAGSDID